MLSSNTTVSNMSLVSLHSHERQMCNDSIACPDPAVPPVVIFWLLFWTLVWLAALAGTILLPVSCFTSHFCQSWLLISWFTLCWPCFRFWTNSEVAVKGTELALHECGRLWLYCQPKMCEQSFKKNTPDGLCSCCFVFLWKGVESYFGNGLNHSPFWFVYSVKV